MDMSKYFGMFLSESRDHLKNMNNLIVEVEQDPANRDGIDSLFREAHSLKGMAASMGFEQTTRLAHYLEDMLDGFRETGAIDATSVDRLLAGADLLETMLDDIEAGKEEQNVDPFINSPAIDDIAIVQEDIAEPEPEVKSKKKTDVPPKGKGAVYNISVGIDPEATVPSARAMIVFKELEKLGTILSQTPSVDDLRTGMPTRVVTARFQSETAPPEIESSLNNIVDIVAVSVNEAIEEKSAAKKDETARAVRVRTDLLDQFINLTGELITNRSMLHSAAQAHEWDTLQDGLVQLNRLISALHYQVLQVRMLPFDSISSRLPRLVRDFSRSSGKKVSLSIEGSDIELDRAILEELGDSLVHLVRNAIDHGIEKEGEVTVKAWREKDLVLIEIADNGKGMDSALILNKAIEKGVVGQVQAKSLRERDIFQLVCAPGFSTAAEITETSGRGVGMDVVKTSIESLGGILDIDSTKGEGTRFLLKVPLSIAIIQILLVECADKTIGIPVTRISRTIDVPRKDIRSSGRRLVCRDGDELIPLLSLHKMLKLPVENKRESLPIVITEAKGRKVGLVVDRLTGQREVFVKALTSPLEKLPGVSGATILGDGNIIFLIDPQTILADRWKKRAKETETTS